MCKVGPFLRVGKVSDGPKPLVYCSNITSVFLIHTVVVIMPAFLGYYKIKIKRSHM